MKDAIYIPAYSDGLMSMFYSLDDDGIAKKYQPDFKQKKSYISPLCLFFEKKNRKNY